MNKVDFLQSLDTKQLVVWRDRAESLSGTYTHFDQKNNSSINFSLSAISVELDRREDKPTKPSKKSKK